MSQPSIIVAPSLLSADFSFLAREIADIEAAGADWHHVDVMDAHFVPNLAFSPGLQAQLKKLTQLPVDTHLMMTHPSRYLEPFRKAGSDLLTIHVECEENVAAVLQEIRRLGMKCGLSLKPGTPVEALAPYLDAVDLILVMTVEPGFGGQSFMEAMLPKIRWLAAERKRRAQTWHLEVDGGINAATGAACLAAGAGVLVAGQYLYGAPERRLALAALRTPPSSG